MSAPAAAPASLRRAAGSSSLATEVEFAGNRHRRPVGAAWGREVPTARIERRVAHRRALRTAPQPPTRSPRCGGVRSRRMPASNDASCRTRSWSRRRRGRCSSPAMARVASVVPSIESAHSPSLVQPGGPASSGVTARTHRGRAPSKPGLKLTGHPVRPSVITKNSEQTLELERDGPARGRDGQPHAGLKARPLRGAFLRWGDCWLEVASRRSEKPRMSSIAGWMSTGAWAPPSARLPEGFRVPCAGECSNGSKVRGMSAATCSNASRRAS